MRLKFRDITYVRNQLTALLLSRDIQPIGKTVTGLQSLCALSSEFYSWSFCTGIYWPRIKSHSQRLDRIRRWSWDYQQLFFSIPTAICPCKRRRHCAKLVFFRKCFQLVRFAYDIPWGIFMIYPIIGQVGSIQ